MGLLSNLKSKFTGSVSKFSGRTDFLEAVCAAAALVAWADGNADDSEIQAAIKGVTSNKELLGAFDSRTIELTTEQMFNRAAGGRVGRNGLYKEIDDVAKDKDMAEVVLLTALDVADSGGISDDEKRVLGEIAKRLGLNLANYM
jgi:tellurite resistance protein